MTTEVIHLPRLIGSRLAAQKIVADLPSIEGERVVLDCRDLRSGSSSFAAELVELLLAQHGGASELVVLAAGDEFIGYVLDAARALRVDDRVTVRAAGSEVDA